ncbi:MAG: hypothetical protein AB1896_11755, partial [Thermodesulfobacteriota bacterium]
KVAEHKPESRKTFEEVGDKIGEYLKDNKAKAELEKFLAERKSKAKIEIFLEEEKAKAKEEPQG